MKVIKPSSEKVNESKILVAYDSPLGSTEEIARFIGDTLSASDQKVDVKSIGNLGLS